MSFGQHIMVMPVGENVRNSNITVNLGGGAKLRDVRKGLSAM
jgi:hypothetical protein